MKKFNLRSPPRKLRNGKVLNPNKNTLIEKKSTVKRKNDSQVALLKRNSRNLNSLSVINKNNSHEMTVNSKYGHLFGSRELVILLNKLPPSIITRVSFGDQSNNYKNNKKNCYKNIEDYIQLNEVQIYNELEPIKTETNLISRKTKRAIMPSRSLKKQNDLKTKLLDHSVVNEKCSETRITRGKTIMLQTEERKQLDQIIFNKFPENTFKMSAVQLDDFTEEVKFLKKLGLTCRFKYQLSTCKVKK